MLIVALTMWCSTVVIISTAAAAKVHSMLETSSILSFLIGPLLLPYLGVILLYWIYSRSGIGQQILIKSITSQIRRVCRWVYGTGIEESLPDRLVNPSCYGDDEGVNVFLWLTMVRDSVNKHIQALVMAKTVYKNSLEGICMNFVRVLLVYNMWLFASLSFSHMTRVDVDKPIFCFLSVCDQRLSVHLYLNTFTNSLSTVFFHASTHGRLQPKYNKIKERKKLHPKWKESK